MKNSSKIGIGIAALLFLLGGLYLFLKPGEPLPPDTLIENTLHEAEHAARRRDVNGVLGTISDDFQAGEWNKARLRVLLYRAVRQSRGSEYDVRVSHPRIFEIPGKPEIRQVVSSLSVFETEDGGNLWGANPATLVMRKETRRHNLFFTEPYWRILSIANAPTLLSPAEDSVGN